MKIGMAGMEEHVHRKCDLVLQCRDSGAQVGIVFSFVSHTVLQCNELEWIIGILFQLCNYVFQISFSLEYFSNMSRNVSLRGHGRFTTP